MTKADIYTFVTSLLFEYPIDPTTFSSFLDVAQDQIEGMRPWKLLQAEDTSVSVSSSNNFATALSMAVDFMKFYGLAPIVLVDANNNPIYYQEVPYAQRYSYQNVSGKFAVDYINKRFYLMGNITQGYTVHQMYVKKSIQVSLSDTNAWVFDAYGYSYSKLLGYLIALQWKGVDYDIINLQNAGELGKAAAGILDIMTRWDSDLQAAGQQGIDPFGTGMSGPWSGNPTGGTIGYV